MRSHDPVDVEYWDTSRLFLECSALGEVAAEHEGDAVQMVHCGLPVFMMNQAHLKTPDADLEAVAARAQAWFGERTLPFGLTTRSDWPEMKGERTLLDAGWQRGPGVPAMRRPLDSSARFARRAVPGLEIRRAKSEADWAVFGRVAFVGFGYPEAGAKLFITPALASVPRVVGWVGFLDGEPMCTSMAILTETVCGIYWVATLEAGRGRGLGEAITGAAVEAGQAAGCRIASLQASEMGRPVYTRMGFERPYDYVRWTPPGQGDPGSG